MSAPEASNWTESLIHKLISLPALVEGDVNALINTVSVLLQPFREVPVKIFNSIIYLKYLSINYVIIPIK